MTALHAAVLDLLLPARCAGCRAPGTECCPACLAAFGTPRPVRLPDVEPPVYALADYRGAARELVLAYKERGCRELAAWLGGLVALALPHLGSAQPGSAQPGSAPWWLVPAPSRRGAARSRGGDHMLRLAQRVDGALVAPALDIAGGARDSVGLDALARRDNLAGRVRLRLSGLPPPGSDVVLVDDVVTTGATAAACTGALVSAGVHVSAVLALTSAVPIGLRHPPQG